MRLSTEREKLVKVEKWVTLAKQSANQNVTGELQLSITFSDPGMHIAQCQANRTQNPRKRRLLPPYRAQ